MDTGKTYTHWYVVHIENDPVLFGKITHEEAWLKTTELGKTHSKVSANMFYNKEDYENFLKSLRSGL